MCVQWLGCLQVINVRMFAVHLIGESTLPGLWLEVSSSFRSSGGAEAAIEVLNALGLALAGVVEGESGDAEVFLIFGDAAAVFLDDVINELEGIAGLVHLVEGVDEHGRGDVLVEKVDEVEVGPPTPA